MERVYGEYKAFERRPSKEELAAAKEEIAETLKQCILSDARWIIREPDYLYNTDKHTIGFKIVFDADVPSAMPYEE